MCLLVSLYQAVQLCWCTCSCSLRCVNMDMAGMLWGITIISFCVAGLCLSLAWHIDRVRYTKSCVSICQTCTWIWIIDAAIQLLKNVAARCMCAEVEGYERVCLYPTVVIYQWRVSRRRFSLNLNHRFQWLIHSGRLIILHPSPSLPLSSPHPSPSSQFSFNAFDECASDLNSVQNYL